MGAAAGTRASSRARVKSRIPKVPNYVWLAMIVLAFTALSFSTYRRAQDTEQDAVQSHAVVSSRVQNVKAANKQIKKQTEQIKTNPRAAEAAAQQQLRVLRRNEVVVARN
jgi:Flp pilus assembly protein TadG